MTDPFAEMINFKTETNLYSILPDPLFTIPALGHSDQIPEVQNVPTLIFKYLMP